MLNFAVIHDDEKLKKFAEEFAKYVGIVLSLSYLKQGTVVGCYDLGGELVGGYALITSPKFRGMMFIPDQVKRESDFVKSVPESMLMEVNAVWLSRKIASNVDRTNFWIRLVKDVLRCKKEYTIVYYNASIEGLKKWYAHIGMKCLYVGRPHAENGERSHQEMYIGYATRHQLRLFLIKASGQILKRFLTSKRSNVQQIAETREHVVESPSQDLSSKVQSALH